MTPELQALVERLEETEKQISHLAALVVEQSDPSRTVVAQSFVAWDTEKKNKAVLGLFENDPALGFFDANGTARAVLGLTPKGPILELADAKQNKFAEIAEEENGAAIRLFHAKGKPVLEIGIAESGPRIYFFDDNGKRRAAFEALTAPGGPWLGLFDANGNVRACLGVAEGGTHEHKEGPWLEFYNAEQKEVVRVEADEHGPKVFLHDANGSTSVSVTALDAGPALCLFDTKNAKGNTSARIQVENGEPFLLCVQDGKVLWSAPPTSSPAPVQPDSNAKGDSAPMSKSWISRAFDRAIERAFLSSVKFFITFAFLAVPVLALLVVAGGAESLAHDWFGIGKGVPDDSVTTSLLAGIVISLLLCIGLRAGAFDWLLQKEK